MQLLQLVLNTKVELITEIKSRVRTILLQFQNGKIITSINIKNIL